MARENLRKVKITQFEDGSGPYTTNAYFHKWTRIPIFSEASGAYIYHPKATIELEDGRVQYIERPRLKFVDEF